MRASRTRKKQATGSGASGPEAERTVDMRPVKAAVELLPAGHPLRFVILGEPDSLSRWEYATKVQVWFRLLLISRGENP